MHTSFVRTYARVRIYQRSAIRLKRKRGKRHRSKRISARINFFAIVRKTDTANRDVHILGNVNPERDRDPMGGAAGPEIHSIEDRATTDWEKF